jgi:hypothetical protein
MMKVADGISELAHTADVTSPPEVWARRTGNGGASKRDAVSALTKINLSDGHSDCATLASSSCCRLPHRNGGGYAGENGSILWCDD